MADSVVVDMYDGVEVFSDILSRTMQDVVFEPMSGCWLFAKGAIGYPIIWNGAYTEFAYHRLYVELVGDIPRGLQLDHVCCNPGCVNPEHLEPVSGAENMRRSGVNKKKYPQWARHMWYPKSKSSDIITIEQENPCCHSS